MFSRFKKKSRVVSIELHDLYIRAMSFTEGNLIEAEIFDYPLPVGVVEEEVVKDEMQFYEIMKGLVEEWKITKNQLRFLVPNNAILMRSFNHPKEIETQKLQEYIETELGQTIHLPFENPLIDVYDANSSDGEAIFFAAPSEDVLELMRLYEDVQLTPTILDVRALCNLRFLKNTNLLKNSKTYLIAEWSIDAVLISIYSNGNVDFLRYQPIVAPTQNWRYIQNKSNENVYGYEGNIEEYHHLLTDQVLELERILNFYRFSLHKGEKGVDEMILIGDNPEMDFVVEQIQLTMDTPYQVIDDKFVKNHYPNCGVKDIALIGLALKGVTPNGS